MKYTGPFIVGIDCTKVLKRLSVSTNFGLHVLGTTLPLSNVEVDSVGDLDYIVDQVTGKKALASQARAIVAKVGLATVSYASLIRGQLLCCVLDSTS